jgi:hypothetical protein
MKMEADMNEQNLDQLLHEHFAQAVHPQHFQHLQRSVWQGIAARERPPMFAWLLNGWNWSQELRAGPAFAAMVIGISLGYATLDMPTASRDYARSEWLGFNMFSSTAYHPLLKANL